MEASTKGREVQEFVERMVGRCNENAKGRKRLRKEANKTIRDKEEQGLGKWGNSKVNWACH